MASQEIDICKQLYGASSVLQYCTPFLAWYLVLRVNVSVQDTYIKNLKYLLRLGFCFRERGCVLHKTSV